MSITKMQGMLKINNKTSLMLLICFLDLRLELM
ncbi:hypothetical protein CsSME_00044901 [Camellia sinensis var. sinensis]